MDPLIFPSANFTVLRVFTYTECQQSSSCSDDLCQLHNASSRNKCYSKSNELLEKLLNLAGWLKQQNSGHFKGLEDLFSEDLAVNFLQQKSRLYIRNGAAIRCGCLHTTRLASVKRQGFEERGNKDMWSFSKYLIEKREHCQSIWLIFGLGKALIPVGIVVDDVELESWWKSEVSRRAKKLPRNAQVILQL